MPAPQEYKSEQFPPLCDSKLAGMKALLSEVLGLKKHLPPSKCPKNDNAVHWGRLMTKLAMVFKWDFACFLCSPDLEFTSFLKQNFPKETWDKIEGNKGF